MSGPRIAVLDYGMGNRRSVEKALEHVGAAVSVTADPAELVRADGLVVPGVGAFPAAMDRLRSSGLDSSIRAYAQSGRPLLGICLGMQLLFEASEELLPCEGLGLLAGRVRRLRAGGLRVPHIGWNDVVAVRPSPLSAALAEGGVPFYHVHSYVAEPAHAEDLIAVAEYGERFATVVGRGRVLGVQFHPEKSSRAGLELLAAFAGLCAGTAEDALPGSHGATPPAGARA